MPIMRRRGFDIVFVSQSGDPGREEFVYLLRWKDRETQVTAWKKFLEDPEWIGVKKATSAKWATCRRCSGPFTRYDALHA
jgi:hypothetical protein